MARQTRMSGGLSGRELHDRATRGEALDDTERTTLQAWYDAEDAVESTSLRAVIVSPTDALRTDVDVALARLQEATQRLQRLSEENAALRRENDALMRRLTRTTQAA